MSGGVYETRLQNDLETIRSEVARVAAAVRVAVDEAVRGLIRFDRDRLYRVILRDHAVNRDTRALDARCHAFVARHLPAARHLRFVSSVLRLNIALERIGDYAVTIARIGARFSRPLPATVCDDIRALADLSVRMLELASRAFCEEDADLARDTMGMAATVDAAHDRVFAQLTHDEPDRSFVEQVGLLTVLHHLERVSDQAKNVCEHAVFTATGETKAPKRYPVMFAEASGATLAPLAEAIARKSYPGSGVYHSGGWDVADAFDDRLAPVAAALKVDVPTGAPKPLGPLDANPASYHVVAAINAEWEDLPAMSFHTLVLRWWIDAGSTVEDLEAAARELSARISDLMEALRGESAP